MIKQSNPLFFNKSLRSVFLIFFLSSMIFFLNFSMPTIPTTQDAQAGCTLPLSLTSVRYDGDTNQEKKGDKVVMCPADHPILLSCFVGDNEGSYNNLDPITRTGLGGDFIYTERVSDGNREGCMSYDEGHEHEKYFVEIICLHLEY